jgi:hypothetical protein
MPQRRFYGDADHDGAPKSDAPEASNVIPMKPKRSVVARPNAEERAFLPAMLEVIETPRRRLCATRLLLCAVSPPSP